MAVMAKGPSRNDLGAAGESIARGMLERKGYRVLDSGFRTREGELDMVLVHKKTLVFCEVKTRAVKSVNWNIDPLESVGEAKRRQIRKMASIWLATRYLPENGRRIRRALGIKAMRFDVVGVTLDRGGRPIKLTHIEDAF